MNKDEARQHIEDQISITHQMLVIAKSFIVKNLQSSPEKMVKVFLNSMGLKYPNEFAFPGSFDDEFALKETAKTLSWAFTVGEALWQLIHSDIIIPTEYLNVRILPSSIRVSSEGGQSSTSWSFSKFNMSLPTGLFLSRLYQCSAYQPLSDCDLYLKELDIEELSPDIETALIEAVRCFRHELYLACLAMLGKASEGAWIELGLALADCIPEGNSYKSEKQKEKLISPYTGIGKVIGDVLKLYSNSQLPQEIVKNSEVRPKELQNVAIWADTVRESRNSIHYGVEPQMRNCYEKVAALLMGAVPHFRILFLVKASADRFLKERVD